MASTLPDSTPTSPLIHCVYASAAVSEFQPRELEKLLAQAREKNLTLNVTGILLYSEGSFLQVLEGQESCVDPLYERIATDPRHARLLRIIREPIAARSFDTWSMGYARVTRKDLATVAGLNGFFVDQRRFLSNIDAGRARTLLAAFADGRWRAKVEATTARRAG